MYVCVCVCVCERERERERERDWIAFLYSRKLTEHCKPTIMEKIKIVNKKENENIFLFYRESPFSNIHYYIAKTSTNGVYRIVRIDNALLDVCTWKHADG